MAVFRFRRFGETTELTSPHMVDLRSRYLMSEGSRKGITYFIGDGSSGGGGGAGGRGGGRRGSLTDEVMLIDGATTGSRASGLRRRHGGGAATTSGLSDDDRLTARSGSTKSSRLTGNSKSKSKRSAGGSSDGKTRCSSAAARADGTSSGSDDDYVSHGADDEAGAGAGASWSRLPTAIRAAMRLLDEGLAAFASSALMELVAASFHGHVRNNRHLERVHLRQAAAKADSSALDIQFFIHARNAELAQEGNTTTGTKLTVERRVEFESLLSQSRSRVAHLRTLLLQFFSILGERTPNLTSLQEVGLRINTAMTATDATFKQLLALCPQSASVMRAYAEFLLASD